MAVVVGDLSVGAQIKALVTLGRSAGLDHNAFAALLCKIVKDIIVNSSFYGLYI